MRIVATPSATGTVVAVTGGIDAASAPDLRNRLSAVLAQGAGEVVVDLAGVPFVDSAGLGALVAFLKEARRSHTSLKLTGLSPSIRRIFELTHLDRAFAIQ